MEEEEPLSLSSTDLSSVKTSTSLVSTARSLSTHRQPFAQDPQSEFQVGEKLPSYQVLVEKLDVAFRRQNEINKVNSKFNSINYMVNVANLVRNKQLQVALREGQQKIALLEADMRDQCETIERLEANVQVLDTQVEEQRLAAEQLRVDLQQTEESLRLSMDQYRQELEKQSILLNEQQRLTQRLMQTKFNQDVLVDGSLLLLSLWVVNMTIIDYPLGVVSTVVSKQPHRRTFARQFVKFLVMLSLYWYTRQKAKEIGMHNSVGSWIPYMQQLASGVISGVSMLPSAIEMVTRTASTFSST